MSYSRDKRKKNIKKIAAIKKAKARIFNESAFAQQFKDRPFLVAPRGKLEHAVKINGTMTA